MNWSRGLFRAWLLLSRLWIAGIGTLAFNTWPRDDWQHPHAASNDKGDPFAKYVLTDAQMVAMLNHADAHRRKVTAHLWHAGQIAFLPPAALFALGCAGLWVAMGFRKA